MSDTEFKAPTENDVQEWWQWLLSIPQDRTPLKGGTNVGENQIKSVWCLACTGGKGPDNKVRELDATAAQKDILVPVFVAAYAQQEAQLYGKSPADAAKDLVSPDEKTDYKTTLEINDRPVTPYYIETGPFKASLPNNHICDCDDTVLAPRVSHEFYSAGWWLKIPHPKQSREYTIKFGGRNGKRGFDTLVTYKVRV